MELLFFWCKIVCHRRMADSIALLQWIKLFHNCVSYCIVKCIGRFYSMDLIDQACYSA